MYGRYSATAIPSDIPSDPGLGRSSTVRFLLCGSEFPEVPEVPEVQKSSRTYTALLGGQCWLTLAVPVPAPVAGHTLGRTVFSLTTGTASLFEFFLFPSLNCVM